MKRLKPISANKNITFSCSIFHEDEFLCDKRERNQRKVGILIFLIESTTSKENKKEKKRRLLCITCEIRTSK